MFDGIFLDALNMGSIDQAIISNNITNNNDRSGIRVQARLDGAIAGDVLLSGNSINNNMFHGVEVRDTSITCLLYTSPSPRDGLLSRMPSSA